MAWKYGILVLLVLGLENSTTAGAQEGGAACGLLNFINFFSLYFVEFNCIGFSIKLVKIAQDNEVRDLLAIGSWVDNLQKAMWGAHEKVQ